MLERNNLNDAVVIFNDDVTSSELLEVIPKCFDGDIVVWGNLIVDTIEFDISGNLWVDGNIGAVTSMISVYGSVNCKNVDAYSLTVYDCINAHQCRIHDTLTVFANCMVEHIKANKVIVRGFIKETIQIIADIVEVDDNFFAKNVSVYDIRVGKTLFCNTVVSKGEIKVIGAIYVVQNLQANNIIANSSIVICNGSIKCNNVTCSGHIKCDAQIAANTIIANEIFGYFIHSAHINATRIKAVSIEAHDIEADDYIYSDRLVCDSLHCNKVICS